MFNQDLTIKSLLSEPHLKNLSTLNYEDDCKKVDGAFGNVDKSGKSAYLGPQLWDKTLDYDEFNLEYMDLDEFLAENGFPANSNEEIEISEDNSSENSRKSEYGVHYGVDFNLNPQDLALASVPGHEIFDPRKRKFSLDELKPQPMIKKSKKSYVPEDLKDERYWNRRIKNNYAAKRSRDARRVKENQIAMRAAYLEQENEALKKSLSEAQLENTELREKLNMASARMT